MVQMHVRYCLDDNWFGALGMARCSWRALAWLLAIADNVLLIPGTSNRSHLAENLAAGSVSLQDDEVASLSTAFDEPLSVDDRDAHRVRRPNGALHLAAQPGSYRSPT
jgi:pyridoxine 4-dehydrogenase